jgi:hypothetical protein
LKSLGLSCIRRARCKSERQQAQNVKKVVEPVACERMQKDEAVDGNEHCENVGPPDPIFGFEKGT